MKVAQKLATTALALRWEDLPPEVIHQSKRVLIDAMGCCLGAVDADAVEIVRGYVEDQQCPGRSTVIGSHFKTSCLNALLVNGVMHRYLDFNDLHAALDPKWYVSGHPGESIPAILSVGEEVHATGRDIITSIVLAYQLSACFCRAAADPPLSKLGWNIDTRGIYIMPLVAGRLFGLNQDQMENALGISGCEGMVLGILDTAAEEYTMAKSLRYPLTAVGGVRAAMLARRGLTGPKTVIEGAEGFNSTVMSGRFDIEAFTHDIDVFHIMDTGFKNMCAVGAVHGHLQATLELVKMHDIRPEQVEHIQVIGGTRPISHTGDPAKKYPVNKETADHSSYYLTAIAVIDRKVGPEQYQPSKYKDPRVLELIERISLKIDSEMDKKPRSGMSIIQTKDGNRYEHRVDYPKGHPKNPMTDTELEQKFISLVGKHLDHRNIEQIFKCIYDLQELQNIQGLMNLFGG